MGVAKLVGAERSAIVAEVSRLLVDAEHYFRMSRGGSPYGDGHAAERIGVIIREYLGCATPVSHQS